MNIEVRLFATLRTGRFKKEVQTFELTVTPKDILNQLDIPIEEVAILLINGHDGQFDVKLKDGDVISVFPPVGGG
ncbi:MAG: MoaD/ThiS family protein [Clostridiales bacterium]|nr:MoaD/ThiS family protein [Clostridiales bacterium]